jgi:NAD(P)-dependent dehydrogenase (short-subunit alcohol dehydrogenase family)
MSNGPQAAIVIGARNLGAEIARHLLSRGVKVASVSRTESDLELLSQGGAVPVPGDAADPDDLARAFETARGLVGPPDLIVNAASAVRSHPGGGSRFGGGAISTSTLDEFECWSIPPARQAFVFLRTGAHTLQQQGGGTLVQIVGANARRANPERGLISAGMAAARALTHSAAQELRVSGIHVGLLIVDGIIDSPKTAGMTGGRDPGSLVRQDDVARAVYYLASQEANGLTHELVITAAGDRWLP